MIVATHKKYEMPNDEIYFPVQSGSAIYPDIGYQRDDEVKIFLIKIPPIILCKILGMEKH